MSHESDAVLSQLSLESHTPIVVVCYPCMHEFFDWSLAHADVLSDLDVAACMI